MVVQIDKIRDAYSGLWKKLTGWKLLGFYIVHYTVLFIMLSSVIFLPFFKVDKSFVWQINGDGLSQHFMRLLYLSRTFREAFQSLLSGGGWNFPLYDFHTGLVAQDLQIGLPQILAVLWPEDKIDVFYNFYVIANYYMVGFSFSAFGFFFRQKPIPVLTGAVAYTFCGYALFAGVRHPHFIVPMIFLPLLLIGAEKVLRKEKAWVLTWVVFLSLTTQWGLYFSCMQAVFVIIFSSVRFFDIYGEEKAREFLKMTGRMAVWGGTGVLLACFSAVPALLQITGSGRVGRNVAEFTNMLHFKPDYYKNLMLDFMVIPNEIDSFYGCWVILGFSAVTIPAVVLLYIRRRREERSLRHLFVIFTAMLCVPAVAYVMSGFSNISGRYCFGYAFLVSAVLMFMVPHFAEMERNMSAVLGIALAAYYLVCYFVFRHEEYQMRPFIMLAVAALVFVCCNSMGRKGRKWIPLCCLLMTLFSVWYSSYLKYSPDEGNYVKEFADDPYKALGRGQYASLASSSGVREELDFYRVTGDGIQPNELNASVYYMLNGLSMYPYFGWSSSYIEWLSEMETARCTNKHRVYDLDARAAMCSLASEKYYAERKTESSFAPYGFVEMEEIKKDKNTDVIWENQYSLPLGYTYENYISRQKYDELTALGRQEAQLQAVVLEEKPSENLLETADVITTAVRIPYEIEDRKNVIWENGKVEVKEPGASMTLAFTGVPATETYLRVVNLDLTEGDSTRRWWLEADTGETSASAGFCADAFVYTHGQKTQMLNLGYSKDGYHMVTVTFPEKGIFLLDDMEIWCQPMEGYAASIEKLRDETLENIKVSGGGVDGTIDVSEDKFLCLSIPYMDGWKAYMDGKEVKLYRANTAFMGMEIPAGSHEIKLRYWIPGLTAGLFMSGAGIICLIAIIMFPHVPRRCFRQNDGDKREYGKERYTEYAD